MAASHARCRAVGCSVCTSCVTTSRRGLAPSACCPHKHIYTHVEVKYAISGSPECTTRAHTTRNGVQIWLVGFGQLPHSSVHGPGWIGPQLCRRSGAHTFQFSRDLTVGCTQLAWVPHAQCFLQIGLSTWCMLSSDILRAL